MIILSIACLFKKSFVYYIKIKLWQKQKKYMSIKPSEVYQVVELPQTGYVSKHPELKKWGFR